MNVLIRYLRQGPDGVPEAQDLEVAAGIITIGSAADCTIQLLGRSVGPRHASIGSSGSTLKVSCSRRRRVRVNGQEVGSATLAVGDEIQIAGHRLQLIVPPAGFDLAFEVQRNSAADASEFEAAFRTDLEQTWLSKRSSAWLLAGLTALLALVIPLHTVFMHRHGAPTPAGLPDDTLWSAGPLTPAHELTLGRKCNACHQQLFVHVQDTACRSCHQPILDHVAKQELALTKLGTPQRCAQCHLEHDGGASLLAVREDGLCVACHANSQALFGSLRVPAVSGFAPGGAHPAFFVTLQTPGGDVAADFAAAGTVQWVARREPVAAAREQSNLKFSHAQHLDPSQVTHTDAGALGCGDCHTQEPNGEHFLPITMMRSCASCHQLTFDQANPSRQLPHGNALEAMYVIEDNFARKYSGDPTVQKQPTPTIVRRMPDREKVVAVPLDTCSGPVYVCANRRAAAEIENQFNGRGCVSCHTVTTDTNAKDIHDRFRVLPVRLTYDYFPKTRFNHQAHAIQKDLKGDAACLSCHNARVSKQSTDVMIPDVNKCLECHGDRYEKDRVTVQCVSCHTYHPAQNE
jgi:predicted CXXCH cytochrome family protein